LKTFQVDGLADIDTAVDTFALQSGYVSIGRCGRVSSFCPNWNKNLQNKEGAPKEGTYQRLVFIGPEMEDLGIFRNHKGGWCSSRNGDCGDRGDGWCCGEQVEEGFRSHFALNLVSEFWSWRIEMGCGRDETVVAAGGKEIVGRREEVSFYRQIELERGIIRLKQPSREHHIEV
jgi:hypothetical protein